MNGVQLTGREKPVPGCLGRMANLFDLTSAVAGNRLLIEKPHFLDGSALSRSRSDVTRMSSHVAEEMGNKMIVSEVARSSSTKKLEGTPMKMLIAQEVSKDLESRHSSPNVVAKLMGLDAIPHQQQQQQLLPDLVHGRSSCNCHLRNCYSELPVGYWLQENGSFDRRLDSEICQCQEQFNYKDIYEIRKSSTKTKCPGDVSPRKSRCNEKKMAHIRKKFMDAKRVSTDEKLRQTKEFQDALEVLSSNQDLFLKVLQEPNSLISHHLYGVQPIPPPTETKRITVLRPSKMVFSDKFPATGGRVEKQVKNSPPVNQTTLRVDESPTQPTRIVVLKPSSGRIQDGKAAAPSMSSSPRGNLHPSALFDESGDCETREAKEVAKEITQRLRENLVGLRRDETFISSVFSNGYTGDESSFSNSEDEFVGNLSDSEVMSPATRHCWDYINRYSSPYSCSSLGRVSFSAESSVAREAKKRLSERWTLMSSNGTEAEHRQVQRSSSTLGEMLALSDIQPEIFQVDDPKRDQDPRVSTSCLTGHFGGDIQSPGNLMRSKSLPVSATSSGLRLDAETLDPEARKIDGPTKQTEKSSFRGRVTSLFFPRSKKLSIAKTDKSLSQDQALPNHAESSVPPVLQKMNRTLWAELNDESGGLAADQVAWSTLKQATPGTLSQNQDQPSPISVLEPPFEEDGSSTAGFSDAAIPNQHGKHMAFTFGKSNLIDKSTPIGSIARTLMFDEPLAQPATSDPPKSSLLSSSGGDEEGEWLHLIQSLLSASGVENESQLSTNLTRWHSPESPLDPLLREKYVDPATEDHLCEANRRQLRSKRRLVFDFVNATLLDTTGMGLNAIQSLHYKRPTTTPAGEALADRVWAQMKDLLWRGIWELEGEEEDGEDSGNLAAEMAVMKELAGREWDDQVSFEIGSIGKEIGWKLLEELVEESIG